METLVFERNGFLYIVGAVAPITPSDDELAELAFAKELRSAAPNENLLWLRGQYVEADNPNSNGQLWTSKELSIKHLTPRFMPVTVMHDPRTAVGLIADTKLLTPEKDDVPRSRIDTQLAVWSHRFPEIAEEVATNYAQGTLMQSTECNIGHYECAECGRGYVKLPQNAERANWCDHLRESSTPVRRLVDVTFNGTGLIFGTRNGARGALPTAHLELAEEIAEFHERAKADKPRRPRKAMEDITITRDEYATLVAKAEKHDELSARVTALEETASKVEKLESDLEAEQLKSKKFKDQRDEARAEKAKLEETAAAETLGSERMGKLGAAFLAKLPDAIKARLTEQARTMADDKWTERLEELSALVEVAHDEGAPASDENAGDVFTAEETARTQMGTGSKPATEPTTAARSQVLGGLLRSVRPEAPAQKQ